MTTSTEIKSIAAAMVSLQSAVDDAAKNKTNPAYKSKYADLSAILDAIRPAMKEAKLAVIQSPSAENGVVSITTRIIHVSGEWIESTLALTPSRSDPQGVGSAITYGRRYSLAALMGITQDDDDGNAASGKAPEMHGGYMSPTTANTLPPAGDLKIRAKELADSLGLTLEDRKSLSALANGDYAQIVKALEGMVENRKTA